MTTTRSIYQRARWRAPVPIVEPVPEWRALSLADIVERIEAIRLDEAPADCPTCGSTADTSILEPKWCPRCRRSLPRGAFGVRSRGGRNAYCRACTTAYGRVAKARQRRKLRKVSSTTPPSEEGGLQLGASIPVDTTPAAYGQLTVPGFTPTRRANPEGTSGNQTTRTLLPRESVLRGNRQAFSWKGA